MQYKVTISFVYEDGANFHEICAHKSETMKYMGLKIFMSDKTATLNNCHPLHSSSQVRSHPEFI